MMLVCRRKYPRRGAPPTFQRRPAGGSLPKTLVMVVRWTTIILMHCCCCARIPVIFAAAEVLDREVKVSSSSNQARFLQDNSDPNDDNESNGGSASLAQVPLWFSVWMPPVNADDAKEKNDAEGLANDATNPFRLGILEAFTDLLCSNIAAQNNLLLVQDSSILLGLIESEEAAAANLLEKANVCLKGNNVDEENEEEDNFALRRRLRYRQMQTFVISTNSTEDNVDNGSGSNSISMPSILDQTPTLVEIRSSNSDDQSNNKKDDDENNPLTWTVWTVTYTALRIGDIYFAEALQNDPTMETNGVEMQNAALYAMQQVLQLALNVNAMNGRFDTLLQRQNFGLKTIPIYSSPLRHEIERFPAARLATESSGWDKDNNNNTAMFMPRVWYPMRFAGMILLVATIGFLWTLFRAAKRRRKRIVLSSQSQQQQHSRYPPPTTTGIPVVDREPAVETQQSAREKQVTLHSQSGVDEMLNRSSFVAAATIQSQG